jgi:hypothetical protein
MYPGVVAVEALNDYKLKILFENDESKVFDITPFLSIGRFKELLNIDMFKTAKVRFDTVEWDNGIDIDPEFLFSKSLNVDS